MKPLNRYRNSVAVYKWKILQIKQKIGICPYHVQINAGIRPKTWEFGTTSEVITPVRTSAYAVYINFTPPKGTNFTVCIIIQQLLLDKDTIWSTEYAVIITIFQIL
ncbi:MAG: hypothetical protein EZS28_035686 [Streblomastix strix]|uniref:Uncharacterized protein n=1 Tax=Streblomastix strix TaxID=222440 RepID=A0A5J4UDY3_9EUKA|nr:MAG: hypothetical protein EZS28_035686 [Streblomastix strix]